MYPPFFSQGKIIFSLFTIRLSSTQGGKKESSRFFLLNRRGPKEKGMEVRRESPANMD
jgi:hypothetical protein